MNGWILGILIGGVLVIVVVALLAMMIAGARRTAEKAEAIVAGLHVVRDGTDALWQVATTVRTADRIVEAAAAARTSLTPGAHGAPEAHR